MVVQQNSYQIRPTANDRPYSQNSPRALSHKLRIYSELKGLGVSKWGFLKRETHYLPYVIHETEPVKAVVYGHNERGSVMLIATDRRVIFLDKKPFFVNQEEMTYDIIGGVTHGKVGPRAVVTLHTKMGDFQVRTVNTVCADNFREYIEMRCLENQKLQNIGYDRLA